MPIKAEDGSLTGELPANRRGHPAHASTLEALAALPPAQNWEPETAPDITAGNSSQTTDGAAAMLIADRAVAEALGLPIRARFVHFAVAAEDAAIVLSAPGPGDPQAARALGHDGRRVRRRGVQRGLRRHRADVAEGNSPTTCAVQPAVAPSPSVIRSGPAASA